MDNFNKHAEIMDMMNLPINHNAKINIHIGATYNNKINTANTFCINFHKLNINTKARLTIENDDKKNGYTVSDLYNLVYIHQKVLLDNSLLKLRIRFHNPELMTF